jgi:hypothetical protein
MPFFSLQFGVQAATGTQICAEKHAERNDFKATTFARQ